MLMLRAKPPESWLPKVMANLDAVLVDHAHLERKAATSAVSLERYQELFHRVADLNAIAIEELGLPVRASRVLPIRLMIGSIVRISGVSPEFEIASTRSPGVIMTRSP